MAKSGSSATSVRVISFAENRTFRSFVLLYTLMSLTILALLGILYFRSAESEMLSGHRLAMQLEGESYLPLLLKWMQGERPIFPDDPAYETAFYLEKKRIGGTLSTEPLSLTPGMHKVGETIYLVISMGSYGLKNGKTVMMTHDDGLWLKVFWHNILLYGGGLFAVLLFIGVGLLRLFLRPMREAVALLDSFIKDTTHELNTPVTAILTNIERLETEQLDVKQRKKIERIETAARTIGSIYDDLTFLLLRRDIRIEDAPLDLGAFVHERLEYFQTRFDAKHMKPVLKVNSQFFITMDRALAARLVDNLLSNAVKYGDIDSEVTVEVGNGFLKIANSGPAIPEDKIEKIFDRYVRADDSRGGFGIGLHLVARIARQYAIGVSVTSGDDRTVFQLTWPR